MSISYFTRGTSMTLQQVRHNYLFLESRMRLDQSVPVQQCRLSTQTANDLDSLFKQTVGMPKACVLGPFSSSANGVGRLLKSWRPTTYPLFNKAMGKLLRGSHPEK